MMALYIFDAALMRPIQEKWLRKPEFMPLNEVTEIIDEAQPLPTGYLLMPTTYENNVKGPFMLSVSSDDSFTLTEILENPNN